MAPAFEPLTQAVPLLSDKLLAVLQLVDCENPFVKAKSINRIKNIFFIVGFLALIDFIFLMKYE